MPFFREIFPSIEVRAGIWQISESAEELHAGIVLGEGEEKLFAAIRNEQRRRHWLANRVLLRHMLHPLSTALEYDPNGKPFLQSGSHHISVSHAGEYAVAAISVNRAVGIDVEKMRDRVERVRERFLSKSELDSLTTTNRLEQLYVLWSGKEALYKIHGNPEVDFRNDINIHPFNYLCDINQQCSATLRINGSIMDYTLDFRTIGEYMVVVAF